MIDGVILKPLKQIPHPLGDILHGIKSTDPEFSTFGEVYFSTIKYKKIKGWKKHFKMRLNLVVPHGSVKVVIYDDRDNSKSNGQFYSTTLSRKNYARLTIEPGLWVAFQGTDETENLMMNFASIPHDPEESKNVDLEKIIYDWN